MKNIKYTSIFFFLILLACQEETIQMPEKSAIPNEKVIFQNNFLSKSFNPRLKLRKGGLKKNIDFSAYLQTNKSMAPLNYAEENSTTAAEKGCGKLKQIVTTAVLDNFDETSIFKYRAGNLIDYIDHSYSDDPSYNGRLKFNYSSDGLTLSPVYTYVDGQVSPHKDIIKLNAKGYAVEWLHDITNGSYENPYTEKIEYNAQGFPTRFSEIYEGKTVSDMLVKYTQENNFETITNAITGDVIIYTFDLTKKQLLVLNNAPVYSDFSRLYGEINTNYMTGAIVKDKAGKTTFTLNMERTFSADGYPRTITRKENGKAALIFNIISLDCKNYTYSAPRTYK